MAVIFLKRAVSARCLDGLKVAVLRLSGAGIRATGTFCSRNASLAVCIFYEHERIHSNQLFQGDGRCAFTITSDTGMSERAPVQKARYAAEALMHACVSGTGPTNGGEVMGIGMF